MQPGLRMIFDGLQDNPQMICFLLPNLRVSCLIKGVGGRYLSIWNGSQFLQTRKADAVPIIRLASMMPNYRSRVLHVQRYPHVQHQNKKSREIYSL
jgi:hypothetical protein